MKSLLNIGGFIKNTKVEHFVVKRIVEGVNNLIGECSVVKRISVEGSIIITGLG